MVEWRYSSTHFNLDTRWERTAGVHLKGDWLDAVAKRKLFFHCPYRESKPGS
jgi:hypothetical protein